MNPTTNQTAEKLAREIADKIASAINIKCYPSDVTKTRQIIQSAITRLCRDNEELGKACALVT